MFHMFVTGKPSEVSSTKRAEERPKKDRRKTDLLTIETSTRRLDFLQLPVPLRHAMLAGEVGSWSTTRVVVT
jgi:hypothetical protein